MSKADYFSKWRNKCWNSGSTQILREPKEFEGGRQSQLRTLGSDGNYTQLASSAWPHGTVTALLRASVARWERRWGANNIPTFPKRIGDHIFMWNILTVKHWKQIQRLKNLFMPNQMCLPAICCPKAPVGWSYANIFWVGWCLSVPSTIPEGLFPGLAWEHAAGVTCQGRCKPAILCMTQISFSCPQPLRPDPWPGPARTTCSHSSGLNITFSGEINNSEKRKRAVWPG